MLLGGGSPVKILFGATHPKRGALWAVFGVLALAIVPLPSVLALVAKYRAMTLPVVVLLIALVLPVYVLRGAKDVSFSRGTLILLSFFFVASATVDREFNANFGLLAVFVFSTILVYFVRRYRPELIVYVFAWLILCISVCYTSRENPLFFPFLRDSRLVCKADGCLDIWQDESVINWSDCCKVGSLPAVGSCSAIKKGEVLFAERYESAPFMQSRIAVRYRGHRMYLLAEAFEMFSMSAGENTALLRVLDVIALPSRYCLVVLFLLIESWWPLLISTAAIFAVLAWARRRRHRFLKRMLEKAGER